MDFFEITVREGRDIEVKYKKRIKKMRKKRAPHKTIFFTFKNYIKNGDRPVKRN